MAENGLQRICFLLRVKPDRLEEYRWRHASVWPEMLKALREAGWQNYSLFLRDDGLLVGYLETPDFQQALARMAKTDINKKWQAEMAEFFEGDPARRPDEQMSPLQEIFHLP